MLNISYKYLFGVIDHLIEYLNEKIIYTVTNEKLSSMFFWLNKPSLKGKITKDVCGPKGEKY